MWEPKESQFRPHITTLIFFIRKVLLDSYSDNPQWIVSRSDVMRTKKDNYEPSITSATIPEKLHYSRYYEHDGALRAYANRAMILAFLCVPTTFLALAFAAYVRLQPPVVIRIDGNGRATVAGKTNAAASATQSAGLEPTEFEKRAFIRLFLERYLNFSPANVSQNWADSLNMMTANLRLTALSGMQKGDLVGKIEEEQARSEFQLRSVEVSKDNPLTYTAFGVKEVHRIQEHNETIDKVVSEFHVRLAVEKRSEQNPSGLLIAEYWESPIDGEKRDLVLQQAGFASFER